MGKQDVGERFALPMACDVDLHRKCQCHGCAQDSGRNLQVGEMRDWEDNCASFCVPFTFMNWLVYFPPFVMLGYSCISCDYKLYKCCHFED